MRTLENLLHSQSWYDGDVLRAHVPNQQVFAGKYVEDATQVRLRDGKNALNERTIEAIAIDLMLDDFGLTIAIDSILSEIIPTTRDPDYPPEMGERYTKTLLIPWEVLICRHFDVGHYLEFWFNVRKKNTAAHSRRFEPPRFAGTPSVATLISNRVPQRLSGGETTDQIENGLSTGTTPRYKPAHQNRSLVHALRRWLLS